MTTPTGLTRYDFTYPKGRSDGLSQQEDGRYVLAADVAKRDAEIIRTLRFLYEHTYLDADFPELRAQNERCCMEMKRLLGMLEERP